MIPHNLRPIFWDIDAEGFEPASHPDYTIARILEFGDESAVGWLKQTFPKAEIERVVANERRLSPRSANFWALVYGIPLDRVAALKASH